MYFAQFLCSVSVIAALFLTVPAHYTRFSVIACFTKNAFPDSRNPVYLKGHSRKVPFWSKSQNWYFWPSFLFFNLVRKLGVISWDLLLRIDTYVTWPMKRVLRVIVIRITLSGRPVMFFFMFWAILTINGTILLIKTHFSYFGDTQDQQKPSLM